MRPFMPPLKLAAAAVFWFQGIRVAPPPESRPAPAVASYRALPNQTFFDRLTGKDLRVRREPRSGTTIIWVNATMGGPAR